MPPLSTRWSQKSEVGLLEARGSCGRRPTAGAFAAELHVFHLQCDGLLDFILATAVFRSPLEGGCAKIGGLQAKTSNVINP